MMDKDMIIEIDTDDIAKIDRFAEQWKKETRMVFIPRYVSKIYFKNDKGNWELLNNETT